MAHARRTMVWVGIFCAVAATAFAVLIDINGLYDLTVIDTTDNCTYVGGLTVSQNGSSLTGNATLTLVSGTGCPASASGSGTGTLSGNTITLGLAFTTVGTFNFTGMVSNDGNFASGSFSGSADGTWTAVRTQRSPAPAMGRGGFAALALLLAFSGVYLVRRRIAR